MSIVKDNNRNNRNNHNMSSSSNLCNIVYKVAKNCRNYIESSHARSHVISWNYGKETQRLWRNQIRKAHHTDRQTLVRYLLSTIVTVKSGFPGLPALEFRVWYPFVKLLPYDYYGEGIRKSSRVRKPVDRYA
jgi:hypothetical protein